tara:strand:+ start:11899 stop:12090 length:192 start_codon:yes stop_codon:yes gene_type:complete
MYILVAILFLDAGHYKIESFPEIFPSYESCSMMKQIMYKNLMATRPTDASFVSAFCAEIPTST